MKNLINKIIPLNFLSFCFYFMFQNITCFGQDQTTFIFKNNEDYDIYNYFDITLNGKVKSILQATKFAYSSCDTIKSRIDTSRIKYIDVGAIIPTLCSTDTLFYYFNQDLTLSKIIKIDFKVIQGNFQEHEKIKYIFKNGNLVTEIKTENGFQTLLNRYKYNSVNNLCLVEEDHGYYQFKECLTYDLNENLLKKEIFRYSKYEDTLPEKIDQTEFEYDTFGNLTKKKLNKNDIDIFKYDSLGNKIEEGYCIESENRECKYIPFKSFIYDQNKKIKSVICLKDNSQTDYFYDDKGREFEVKSYKIKDSILYYHFIKEYNEKGQLIREESFFDVKYYEPKYLKYMKKEITYDLYGNITQLTFFNGDRFDINFQFKNFDIMIYKYLYKYDSYGNWIKREEYIGESEDKLELNQIDNRIIEYY